MSLEQFLIAIYSMFFSTSWAENLNFCRTGQLDSAVRTHNGRIFIFFGLYLVELNGDLTVKNRNPTPIRNYFRVMNFDRIDASFTADGYNNRNRGKTYLIRNNIIKEYQDLIPTGLQSNISQWLSSRPINRVDLVINQIGDSIAIFFDERQRKPYERDLTLYYFDSVSQPAVMNVAKIVETRALIDSPQQNNLLLRAVIGLSNDSYLVFYNSNDGSDIGKYCVTKELREGVS